MGKRTNEDRKFTENIDRLLSGEEPEGVDDMGEDFRTAINLAQKLTELRADPSAHFKDQLKQRLLLQLTRQEMEAARRKEKGLSFWEFLRNLLPESPVWRTATATLVVVLVTLGVLWRTGTFTQAPVLVSPEIERAAPESELPETVTAPREMEATLQQGAIEEVTVHGITITLERVELSTSEARFYAFNVPPDYSLPQGPELPPPSLMKLLAHARYSIDGSPMIDAGPSEIHFLDDRMQHVWSLDPMPEDATEVTFVITRLGDWDGPWEFVISLQD